MAKAKKSESESESNEAAAEPKKPAAKKASAKKTEAGAGTAPMAAIPAPSAQPAKPAAGSKPAPASAKKPAAKKGGKNEPARSSPMGSPLVDTSLAAESAARMLAGRAKHGSNTQSPQGGKESGLFRQLKQNVNKPATSGGGNTLSNTFAPSRGSNLPISGGKQVAHNQTQGGINKINVPRRTGG